MSDHQIFTWECSECGESGVFGEYLWMPSHAARHVKSALDVIPKLIVRMEES